MRNPRREDQRQRRTRRLLTDALLSLLEERPFREIPVVEICRRAGVHCTTFYAHFDDKQALLRHAVGELERSLEAGTPPPGREAGAHFLSVFRNALTLVREHGGLFRAGDAAWGGAEGDAVEAAVTDALRRVLSQPGLAPGPGLDQELTARFYAGAVRALLRWWLSGGAAVPEEVLLRHLEGFLPPLRPEQAED